MPIYEYKCRKNGHIFEVRQGFNDPEVQKCEACDSPVDRLVSPSAFHLKGTGWYTTDYKKSDSTGASSKKTEASNGDGCAGGACGTNGSATNCSNTKKE